MRNETLVRNSGDTKSTYIMCSCGDEILEFQRYDPHDYLHPVDFYLIFHGDIRRKKFKAYNLYAFIGSLQLKQFLDCLKTFATTEMEAYDYATFAGEYCFIEVCYDFDNTICIRAWKDAKSFEKSRKSGSFKKCVWELCGLEKETVLRFVNNIKNIAKEDLREFDFDIQNS